MEKSVLETCILPGKLFFTTFSPPIKRFEIEMTSSFAASGMKTPFNPQFFTLIQEKDLIYLALEVQKVFTLGTTYRI